jgi:branched-chain amino acid transport system substrate-binding protein
VKTTTVRATVAGLAALLTALAACSSSDGGNTGDTSSPSGSGGPAASGSGFTVNLDDCDDADAARKQVTGSWKIGYSLPLSGPVAGVVNFAADGYKARIAAQNAAGGINGVKLEVVYKDDAFTPDRAKANVTEFIQKEQVNSLTTFGSGPVGAMADDQNAACVPLLYPSSSVPQFRDIKEYPWTVQFLPAADKEAQYDIKLIQQKFPNGATVGIAENQTASGKGYSAAFQNAVKGTNVTVAVVAPSTDPNAAAAQIKAKNPDVVYIAGITTDCGPDVQALARIGFTPKLVINPSNCADKTGYIAAGAAADGGVLPSYLKNPADPALASDAGMRTYLQQVTTADKDNSITVAGWVTADLTINTLTQASGLPGGLTRENVIKAARDQSYECPMLINGIKWVSSPAQLLGFSAFQTTVWDAGTKAFKADGELISLG